METIEFWKSFAKCRGKFVTPEKDQVNKHTKQKYWSVAVLNDAARDCFGDEIVYYFTDVNAEDQVGCTITLIHLKSGQSHSQLTLVDKVKKTEQGCGTGYTYAKRYCLMGLFALGDPENDNDAQHEEEPAETDKIDSIKADCEKAGMNLETCLRSVKASNWNLSDNQIAQLRKILKEREQVSQQDSFL
jgi:hypothetical protein|tara:strand:- start:4057 stop:4620 length:564 start_codon:yes stop_codon:yes gene_type:complete